MYMPYLRAVVLCLFLRTLLGCILRIVLRAIGCSFRSLAATWAHHLALASFSTNRGLAEPTLAHILLECTLVSE